MWDYTSESIFFGLNGSMKDIVFTDLDGSLLDASTYSYREALDTLNLLGSRQIPLIFCSTKTRFEQEVYREALAITAPFIVENGGAIFVPDGYFPFTFEHDKTIDNYRVIELGMPYARIRQLLKETGYQIKGFGDMSVEEIDAVTGLDLEMAALAMQREYSETLLLEGRDEEIKQVLEVIQGVGLAWMHGGRFYSVTGGNDKGEACQILLELLRKKFTEIRTIGIGDSANDLPMLKTVDIPVLVQKEGRYWEDMELPGLVKVKGVGPQGWRRAILSVF